MGTYTPNLNLYKPDASDDFGSFRAEFNDNMDKLDNGGGGGSGGHTILDPDGNSLPQENDLQFTGAVNVSDDNVNGKTIVDIKGGNVYGAYVDTSHIIKAYSTFTSAMSYTAVEDCFVMFYIVNKENTTTRIQIDGEDVQEWWRSSAIPDTALIPVKKGQTVSTVDAHSSYTSEYTVYGVTQGTSGIFAPVIYSDVERKVGVWRDNKPLYQKTFIWNETISGDTTNKSISLDNPDYAFIVDASGINYAGAYVPLPYVHSNNVNNAGVFINSTKDAVGFRIASGMSLTYACITIRYTKTTDVAGSGDYNTYGVPTVHYSTSEQVVGTWIDGKPIYERTWDFSASPVMLSYANWVDSGISASENIKSIISAELKYGTVTNMAVEVGVGADGYPVAFQKVENTGNTRGVTYCTLRYTKTTD